MDAHFRAIDDALYASESYPPGKDDGAGNNGQGQGANVRLSGEMKDELQVWKDAFPHLR